MVWLVAAIVSLVVIPYGFRAYFRASTRYTNESLPVWERLSANSGRLIDDDGVPDLVADFAYSVAMCAGCGCVTTRLLYSLVRGKMRKRNGISKLSEAISELTDTQSQLYGHIIADALLFDSFQVPLRGLLLRRILWWLSETAEKRQAMLPEQMEDVSAVTQKVVSKEAEKVPALVAC